jgi:Ca-activated chloride channel family protein
MDVDTASYTLVRAYLTRVHLPPKAAVRTEEFLNAFHHGYAPPAADSGDVFAIHAELAPSPFGEGKVLLQVGLKARETRRSAPSRRAHVHHRHSGSMAEGGRLELVKARSTCSSTSSTSATRSRRRLLDRTPRRVLPIRPTPPSRSQIFAALDALRPKGSTNADAGLRLGYDIALEQLK